MNKYDFYDSDKVEKLRGDWSGKYIKIVSRFKKAKEKGDQEAVLKAMKALSKHKAIGEKYKEFAEEAGVCWY